MNESFKFWEWTPLIKNGGYTMQRTNEETRKKQLEEYKKRKRAELTKELRELEMLF